MTCCGGNGVSCGGAIVRTPAMTHEAYVQCRMIADAYTDDKHPHGWARRGFTDPKTLEPLTLGQVFDHYAVALIVCEEFGV